MSDFKIRILREEDVTQAYVNWFHDQDVVRYSDNQYREFSLEGQKAYVRGCESNTSVRLYGIFSSKSEAHIGNVVIGAIDLNHRRAEVTYVVGDRAFWGKGVATFAVGEAVRIARDELNLVKVYAGCAASNEASKKVLERNSFSLEGVRKSHLSYGGTRDDQFDYGLVLR
ncbi:MAG: GNAT family N-acetyltransferase [Bdellovibrionota bacterium]